ncbi:MAG: restriction endonuclease subunit S, partial [Ginsengibacter sp.]
MSVRAPVGPVNYATEHCCIGRGLAAIRVQEKIKKEFLFYLLKSLENSIKGNGGAVFDSISRKQIEEIKIPLPPLSIQEEIVAEIESYQKIIDGAKAVVENYKPKIDIDPDWEMLELDSVAKIVSGFSFNSTDFKEDNSIKCIKITNVGVREFIDEDSSRLPQEYLTRYSQYQVNAGDIVISLTRTIISSGLKVAIVPEKWNGALVNQRVACIKPTKNSNINFLYHYLCSKTVCNYVEEQSRSLMQPNLSITDLKRLLIPNPPIELQNELVAQIEKEESLANSNSELVEIFEQKIKDRIAKVWGK